MVISIIIFAITFKKSKTADEYDLIHISYINHNIIVNIINILKLM